MYAKPMSSTSFALPNFWERARSSVDPRNSYRLVLLTSDARLSVDILQHFLPVLSPLPILSLHSSLRVFSLAFSWVWFFPPTVSCCWRNDLYGQSFTSKFGHITDVTRFVFKALRRNHGHGVVKGFNIGSESPKPRSHQNGSVKFTGFLGHGITSACRERLIPLHNEKNSEKKYIRLMFLNTIEIGKPLMAPPITFSFAACDIVIYCHLVTRPVIYDGL